MSALSSSRESLDLWDMDWIAQELDRPNPTNMPLACFLAFAHAVPAAWNAAWNASPALVHQINTSAKISQAEGVAHFPVHMWQPQHLPLRTKMSCSYADLQTREIVFFQGRGCGLTISVSLALQCTCYILDPSKYQFDEWRKKYRRGTLKLQVGEAHLEEKIGIQAHHGTLFWAFLVPSGWPGLVSL